MVVSLLVPFAPMRGAAADPVGDRTAQAQRLAAQLDALSRRSSQLDEVFNQARLRLDQTTARLDAAKAALGSTDSQLDGARTRVRDMAVQSYMQGGGVKQLSLLIPSTASDIGVRGTYVKSVTANTNDAVDQLHQAHVVLTKQQADLAAAQAEAARAVADLAASRKQAADAEASVQAAYTQAQAQVGDALVQAQAQLAAASQQRIQAAITSGHDPLPATNARALASPSRPGGSAGPQRASSSPPGPGNAQAAPSPSGSSASPGSSGSSGSAPSANRPEPPPAGPGAQGAIAEAQRQLGKPYYYGGSGPDSFDCSGLTAWAWGHAGRSLPHSAADQYYQTTHVSVSQLQPGDLVFWGMPPHHVGIYVGNGQMINALHSGTNVRYENIYEESDLIGGGRLN
ncbi:MAG: hypothetical protein NVSMB4_06640 [Acidimicrobiales bacterium]